MSVSKWNLFCLKILHNKLFTRNTERELRQIEHLVPDQLAELHGNTRTLDAVAGPKRLGLQFTDSTHCQGKSAACQRFRFAMLLTDVWGFLALWPFVCCWKVFRLGSSDTVREYLESIKHDCVALRVMVKVWGPRWRSLYWEKVLQRNGSMC